jgi:hypothetical protein
VIVLDRGASKADVVNLNLRPLGSAVVAALAVFLRYLLKQPLKVASTSEELLDLFEHRCASLEGDATLISPDDEGRASEHFTLAASNDLASVNTSSTELPTSAEACVVYRIQPGCGPTRNNNGRDRSLGTFASAEEETALRHFGITGRGRKESNTH